jgi:orotidine-5'-phosphate decarboxylase
MKKNIFLALDFDSLDKALKTVDETKEYLAGIKIGLELYSAIGLDGIKKLEVFNLPVFLDTKIFDIPNQVSKTLKIISKIKLIKYYTIHSLGSLKMLEAAKKSTEGTNLNLLAVTLLTSWDSEDLDNLGIKNNLNDQIKILVEITKKAKLSGVIASAQDIKLVRSISKDMKIFCPGIRESTSKQDQKRVLNYSEFNKLADDNCFAVIGRPIYEGNALENIKKIIDTAK